MLTTSGHVYKVLHIKVLDWFVISPYYFNTNAAVPIDTMVCNPLTCKLTKGANTDKCRNLCSDVPNTTLDTAQGEMVKTGVLEK